MSSPILGPLRGDKKVSGVCMQSDKAYVIWWQVRDSRSRYLHPSVRRRTMVLYIYIRLNFHILDF